MGQDLVKGALAEGKAVEIRSFGFSMWPRIKDGAPVRVEPCAAAELQQGDVVLFDEGSRLVLHRVLRLSSTRALIKGDACPDVDGWIPLERVLGRLPRRSGDLLIAQLAPHVSGLLGFTSTLARRIGEFTSKF